MQIRTTGPDDLDLVLGVVRRAFGASDVVDLVRALLTDPSAQPAISLVATDDEGAPLGHALFTAATLAHATSAARCSVLSPLAVVPEHQNEGIGGALIQRGLEIARAQGVDLVFVLGQTDYYRRHGFRPSAGSVGLLPPFPMHPKHERSWMVLDLRGDLVGEILGTVTPARALQSREHWRE
jgi:putative acetyltransferase